MIYYKALSFIKIIETSKEYPTKNSFIVLLNIILVFFYLLKYFCEINPKSIIYLKLQIIIFFFPNFDFLNLTTIVGSTL